MHFLKFPYVAEAILHDCTCHYTVAHLGVIKSNIQENIYFTYFLPPLCLCPYPHVCLYLSLYLCLASSFSHLFSHSHRSSLPQVSHLFGLFLLTFLQFIQCGIRRYRACINWFHESRSDLIKDEFKNCSRRPPPPHCSTGALKFRLAVSLGLLFVAELLQCQHEQLCASSLDLALRLESQAKAGTSDFVVIHPWLILLNVGGDIIQGNRREGEEEKVKVRKRQTEGWTNETLERTITL